MALRGRIPDKKNKRAMMFWYGEAGSGKTIAALSFPRAYIIDTENGTAEYTDLVKEKNSSVFQSNSFDDVLAEVIELKTTNHPFVTLVIDPITILYADVQDKWTKKFQVYAKEGPGKELEDFGMRYWQNVKKDYKRLQRELVKLDMNVIVTAHQKDVYGNNFQKIGVSFDSMKGDNYFFSNIFQIQRKGEKLFAKLIKERALPGQEKFGDGFEWSYDTFADLYGRDILERDSVPIKMATPEQIQELQDYLETVRISEDTIAKWLKAADADDFTEFTEEQIIKCIGYCKKKISGE